MRNRVLTVASPAVPPDSSHGDHLGSAARYPISHHTVQANGIRQHYVEAGSGPPVILLHGFPLYWYQWRKLIPLLAPHYRVIAPDLRGYGATEKPPGGYDKRTMAADLRALMQTLGIERAAIVGHDRGARVATRFAKDHADATVSLTVIDNIPTRVIFNTLDARRAKPQWFFIFNSVPALPEVLIEGREAAWLRWFYNQWCYDPECIGGEDFLRYVRNYQAPGAVRGALDDYRAGPQDLEQDEADADQTIKAPTLVLWGEQSSVIVDLFDIRAVWREMAENPRFVPIPRCGHLPPEEQPVAVAHALLDFLSAWQG